MLHQFLSAETIQLPKECIILKILGALLYTLSVITRIMILCQFCRFVASDKLAGPVGGRNSSIGSEILSFQTERKIDCQQRTQRRKPLEPKSFLRLTSEI